MRFYFLFFKPKHFGVGSCTARNRREIIREKDAFRLSGLTTIMMTQTTKRKMMILPVQSATFPPIHLTFTDLFFAVDHYLHYGNTGCGIFKRGEQF